jgi:hypothetical protein
MDMMNSHAQKNKEHTLKKPTKGASFLENSPCQPTNPSSKL